MTSDAPTSDLASGFETTSAEVWRALVDKALKGADFDKRLIARTADGIALNPLYTRADARVGDDTTVPGQAPYTRGTHTVREGTPWDIRSFHSEVDPAAANAAILDDLSGGVTSIALHMGPAALPVSKDALDAALRDVMLDVCPIVLVANGEAFEAARCLMTLWNERGIPASTRQGAFGCDPLATLAIYGYLDDDIETALARGIALMKASEESPRVAAMTADGVGYHNSGASEAQELACVLATLVAYLRAAERGGIAPSAALTKITVSLAADADEFSTIAKLRAARRLVWRVADACGAGEAARNVKFNVPTSYRMMARRDPWTNILRTTIACTGAALGGADAILVLPFTFALGKTDAFSRRVARNIQIVCQEESNLGRVTDPAGGSWYVESLTGELARKAWDIFQDIEARGGMLVGLTTGYVQEMIAKTAAARQKAIATGKIELTGVSAFPLLGDDGVHCEPWPKPRDMLKAAPQIEVTALTHHRLSEDFEALRDAADAAGGYTVFLASMGEIADHNVRTTWVKNYLAAGGIATLISDGYTTASEAADAFKASGASAACICSSDAVYAALAEDTARTLKDAGAQWVLMAGKPGDKQSALKAAGVDQFLVAGADAVETLQGLQARLTSA